MPASFPDMAIAAPIEPQPDELAAAAKQVQTALGELTGSGNSDDRDQALAALRAALPALLARLQAHHPTGSGGPTTGRYPGEYASTLISAAQAAGELANDPCSGPDTTVGRDVLTFLLGEVAAADRATKPTPPSDTVVTTAARGVLHLIGRPDWMAALDGTRIRAAARELLDHPNASVRALAIDALARLEPDPAARLRLITDRIKTSGPTAFAWPSCVNW